MTDPLTGVSAFYDRHSAAFLEHAGPTFQAGLVRGEDGSEVACASNLALAKRAGIQAGDRVLDAGCGVAGPAIDLATHIEGVQVDGVTLSAVQARMGQQRVLDAGLAERVRVHEGDYHRLRFADGSFDCVLFLESAGYSTDLPRLFGEASRVLRPGGRLYVKDVVRREGLLTEQQLEELADYDATWAVPSTPTARDLVDALSAAGFVDVGSAELALGSAHFIGSMFEVGPQGFALNEFGRACFRRFVDLPVLFAEVHARRPHPSLRDGNLLA